MSNDIQAIYIQSVVQYAFRRAGSCLMCDGRLMGGVAFVGIPGFFDFTASSRAVWSTFPR